jgi:hypothetical protein
MSTINELINKARQTTTYTIDTESEIIDGQARGAVIQIQFVHSKDHSTIVITEMFHLPDEDSLLFSKIRELYSIIFNNGNEIITWGTYTKEFENFQDYQLIESGNQFESVNLQEEFQGWHNEQTKQKTHPQGERRETTTGHYVIPGGEETKQSNQTICNCGHRSHYDPNATWSLQDAISSTKKQFLDKTETINRWTCGLDLDLETWRRRTFNKYEYNPTEEKRKRLSLVDYAANDCLVTSELFFIIYPFGRNISRRSTLLTASTTEKIRRTTTKFIKLYDDDELSNISDEEIELSRLKPPAQQEQQAQPTPEVHLERKQEEEQRQLQEIQQRQRKAERQKKKNEKLKWKRENRPDFQIKIRRPIFEQYDYRKVRAQLTSDKIYTCHQLTINWEKLEVSIGFKSTQDQEEAKKKMPINYFSMEEYQRRWGKTRSK